MRELSGIRMHRGQQGRPRVIMALMASAMCTMALPSMALAQSSGQAGKSDGAGSDNGQINDIIVTASKTAEPLSKVGEGISVVTGEQLQQRAAKSLSDYMALTPGLNVQSFGSSGWGWVEIRGISPQSVGATVATYVDEIPVGASSALARSGEYTPDLDPSDLERVEVLKGPQGTLYGSSSLGGVIKYVTKGPSLTTTEINTSEELSFLDNGQPGTKLRASATAPIIPGKLGVRVSGFYRHDAGFIHQLGLERDNANYGDSWGFRGAIRWKPVSDLTIDLTSSVENSNYHGYSLVDLDPATLKPLFGVKDSVYRTLNEGFRVRTDLLSATVKWNSKLGTLTSATSYSYQAPGETGDLTLFFSPTLPNQPQDPDAVISFLHPAGEIGVHSDKKTTEELRFNSSRLGPLEFTVGGFYQHENIRDGANYYNYHPDGTIDYSRPLVGIAWRTGTLSEYAGFANATFHLADKLDVTGGYRHSHIDQTRSNYRSGYIFGATIDTDQSFSENADTYLAGIRWRPTDGVLLYGRAASGYRPGGGRSIPPGAPADFGSTYTSDSIWSYEAGTKIRSRDGRFVLDADAFWIDWSDIQTLVYVGRFSTDGNGGTARSRGVEVQGEYKVSNGLTLSANAAYTDAKFSEDAPDIGVTKGERIYFVPKWTATAAIDYHWALNDKWTGYIGGDYDYRSDQLDGSRFVLPASHLLNFHGGVRKENFGVNIYIKNATNQHIFVGDSSGYYPDFPPFEPIISQPREIGIAFNQKF